MITRRLVFNAISWLLLLAAVGWSIFPPLLILLSSVRPPAMIFDFPPRFVFRPTLANYVDLLSDWPGILPSIKNSIIITVGSSSLGLLVGVMAAYAFSRYRNSYLRASAFFVLAIRMFPPILITIPLFPVLQRMGLIDRHITLIILYATLGVSLTTWLMKSFIDDVPREVEEAALIDGCGLLAVLARIILPIAAPGLVATLVFAALLAWNDFAFAFIFTSANARTTPLLLNEMLGSVTGVEWGPLFAATTLQFLPILVFVWAVQKHLVKGVTVGSVKG